MSINALLDDGTTPAKWKKLAVEGVRFGGGTNDLSSANVISATGTLIANVGGLPIGTIFRYARVGKQVTISIYDNALSHMVIAGGGTVVGLYTGIPTVGALIQADRTALGRDWQFPCLVSATNANEPVPGEFHLLGNSFQIQRLDITPGLAVDVAANGKFYNLSISYSLP